MTSPAWAAPVDAAIAAHRATEGPLLPILHAVQAALGHVPQEALPRIAEALGVTRAEVYGVMSFYHDFHDAPPARHEVRICRAEACQAMGADALIAGARVKPGETAPGGAVAVQEVFCLGLCACGPAALVDGQPVGRLDARRLDDILAECGA